MREIILCILFLTQGIGDARKINVGGTNRGSSAARTNAAGSQHYPPAGGYHPPAGGYHPQQTGYHPQGGYNPQGGYHPQAGYRPNQAAGYHPQGGFPANQPRFNPGTGVGSKSSSSGTFKKALLGGALGAAGGIAVYELGKAILHSGSQPLHAPNGQNYYFDDKNYQGKAGYFMCSMPLDEVVKTVQESSTPATTDESGNSTITPEQFFKTVQFKDGSRPKTLTWSCRTGTEVCCGTECCPAPQLASAGGTNSSRSKGPSWVAIIFGILAGIALLMCCCCCLAYKLCRSAFDMCLPSRNTNEDRPSEVVYTEGPVPTGFDNTQGGMQPSYGAYPPPGGYPPQQGYNYPNQPYPQQQQQYY